MSERRIPETPQELAALLMQIINGISGEPNWPATGPTVTDVNNLRMALEQDITQVDVLIAQLATRREELHGTTDSSYALAKNVDAITDGLYGPSGPKKLNFGLPPKKSSKSSVTLKQVIIQKVQDGNDPASILLDWEPVNGAAAYQIEWYTDANLTELAGNAAASKSEFEITGLIAKKQYWMRVRAIRGDEHGPWSDRATRVANL